MVEFHYNFHLINNLWVVSHNLHTLVGGFLSYSIGKERSESSPSDSVPDFFWGDGGAWHASGCQKGAAEEPLRGCLN